MAWLLLRHNDLKMWRMVRIETWDFSKFCTNPEEITETRVTFLTLLTTLRTYRVKRTNGLLFSCISLKACHVFPVFCFLHQSHWSTSGRSTWLICNHIITNIRLLQKNNLCQTRDAELNGKYGLIKYLLLLLGTELRGGISITFCSCKAKNCSITFERPLKLLISHQKQIERFRKYESTYSQSTV